MIVTMFVRVCVDLLTHVGAHLSQRTPVLPAVVWVWLSVTSLSAQTLGRYQFRRGLMGTQFSLTLYATDSLTANRANKAVSARMDSLNQVMSDYQDGSEINRLSETAGSGRWIPLSADLFGVLAKAQTIARLSGGRYDPTVGPLSLLWRRAVRRGEFPTAKQRRQAHRAVGYRLLELDSTTRSARLRRPGMRLDVGGIGQGFANDEAMRVLQQLSIRSALLDLGGDILIGDAPPGQAGWRVSIGSPETGDTATLVLHNVAITTSGDLYRHLDYRGKRYSHIMNPRSGLGLRHFVRATVSAPTGWQADALTKVFSVAGLRQSYRLIRRFPYATVQLVERKRGRLHNWQSTSLINRTN